MFRRIKQRLDSSGERLHKTRRVGHDLGEYYLIDVRRNEVIRTHVDIRALAKELGCSKPRPRRPNLMVGDRFGHLIVIEYIDSRRVRCVCTAPNCGNETTPSSNSLRRGKTKSCGCSQSRLRHGQSAGKRSPSYRSWRAMIGRCTNPNNPDWKDYGGRGIKVCDLWRTSFEAFFADLGERPAGLTLDRVDNDGDYEPGNCRWATSSEQSLNRRPGGGYAKLNASQVEKVRILKASGSTTRDLAVRFGVAEGTVRDVVRGDTWKNVPGPLQSPRPRK